MLAAISVQFLLMWCIQQLLFVGRYCMGGCISSPSLCMVHLLPAGLPILLSQCKGQSWVQYQGQMMSCPAFTLFIFLIHTCLPFQHLCLLCSATCTISSLVPVHDISVSATCSFLVSFCFLPLPYRLCWWYIHLGFCGALLVCPFVFLLVCLFCSILVLVSSTDSAFIPSKSSANHILLPLLRFVINSLPPCQGRLCSENLFLRYARPLLHTLPTVPSQQPPVSFQPLQTRCCPDSAIPSHSGSHLLHRQDTRWRIRVSDSPRGCALMLACLRACVPGYTWAHAARGDSLMCCRGL